MHAYSDCDKHSTFDSVCATKKELGHWDTILQTQSEIVHLTSMGDFICSVWCSTSIPLAASQYQTSLSAKVWNHGLHMTYM